jgi:hypothetical protein
VADVEYAFEFGFEEQFIPEVGGFPGDWVASRRLK